MQRSSNYYPIPWDGRQLTLSKHTVLATIDQILNVSEEDLFQKGISSPAVNLQLDNLLEWGESRSYTQGVDVTKMSYTLRSKKEIQNTTPWVWPFIVILASIGCGALWPMWFRFVKQSCPWTRKCICIPCLTKTPLVPELKGDEIGLQILPQGGGSTRGEVMP
jgi:hypothetical protein